MNVSDILMSQRLLIYFMSTYNHFVDAPTIYEVAIEHCEVLQPISTDTLQDQFIEGINYLMQKGSTTVS